MEEPQKDIELEFHTDHHKELIIDSSLKRVLTRSKDIEIDSHSAFLSSIEPKNFQWGEKEESWLIATQEELNQFEMKCGLVCFHPKTTLSLILDRFSRKN